MNDADAKTTPLGQRIRTGIARFFGVSPSAMVTPVPEQGEQAEPLILDEPIIAAMAERHVHRADTLRKCPNILPPDDIAMASLDALLECNDPPDDIPVWPEDMRRRSRQLRIEHAGQPKFIWLHGLTVAYLEMNTLHTDHARTLFLRLWRERGTALCHRLATMDLIQALGIFARHGETAAQRAIGAAGATYGTLLHLVESERALAKLRPRHVPRQIRASCKEVGFAGLAPLALDQCREPLKMHDLLFDLSLEDSGAGLALQSLCVRSSTGATIFSRWDRARLDVLGPEAFERPDHWCFGLSPDQLKPRQ